ncbi:resolvase domain protein [Mycolicibacterium thermoresistibile]|uniref:Resolvase domain protein n=1 Tax=Mycolicibacterium thermoresistibile TaxID=1797 RepID=A0A100XDG0_MYCTH|nr:resolvase domain protein [Mycolicibacterium thermoresistibile]
MTVPVPVDSARSAESPLAHPAAISASAATGTVHATNRLICALLAVDPETVPNFSLDRVGSPNLPSPLVSMDRSRRPAGVTVRPEWGLLAHARRAVLSALRRGAWDYGHRQTLVEGVWCRRFVGYGLLQ